MGRYCAPTLLIGALLLSGCHQMQDCIDEQISICQSNHRAKCAWVRCRGNYVDCQDYLWDFGAGFRSGYADILNGGRGCPPPFVPRSYWGCCYKNESGQCAIAAWYDGYHHGVAAALADGYGAGYGTIPSSVDIYHRCQRRPVQIDIEQYKASRDAHLPIPAGESVPLPSEMTEPAIPAPPEEPYSPQAIEAPADPTLPQPAAAPLQD